MMSAEFAALSVIDLQPNLSGLGARRCVGGLSKTASLAGIFVGSWLVSFASMAIAIGYVRLVVGVDFGGREGLCLVGGAASALAATGQVWHPHGLCHYVRPVRRPLRRASDGACRRRRPRLPG